MTCIVATPSRKKQEVKTIANATAGLYTRLTDGLRHITYRDGWEVLADLDFSSYIEEKDPDQLMEMEGRICPINICEDTDGKFFRCACGKKHISRLSIMEYKKSPNWEYLILGSECINTLEKYVKDLEGIDNIKEKINKWVKEIKEEVKKIKYKKCIACEEYKISRTTNYKNPARNHWCNNCSSAGKVRCVSCKNFRFFELDWKGNPKKYCRHCYFSPSVSF